MSPITALNICRNKTITVMIMPNFARIYFHLYQALFITIIKYKFKLGVPPFKNLTKLILSIKRELQMKKNPTVPRYQIFVICVGGDMIFMILFSVLLIPTLPLPSFLTITIIIIIILVIDHFLSHARPESNRGQGQTREN